MQVTVGTSAVQLSVPGDGQPVIQNLGPGIIYIDRDSGVTTSTGFRVEVDAVYEFPHDLSAGGGALYVVSDTASTDVRYLVVG